ncbi:hypothetical protein OD91_1093 [Lutibacter sp. Hel_I_33_5]|uniref:hypothetical protein n=1 Tax=Lutibacter sp. Hel_I_33_5 TaxID=1566289 RepID=UPI0011ACF4B8|nr:hypothetical protein [Lutibacter sp. Hel_I_33_5]TVZ55825.1 hypothetical protein OD91_1093 [Lutibacter sp. Hel_I_33_5]
MKNPQFHYLLALIFLTIGCSTSKKTLVTTADHQKNKEVLIYVKTETYDDNI